MDRKVKHSIRFPRAKIIIIADNTDGFQKSGCYLENRMDPIGMGSALDAKRGLKINLTDAYPLQIPPECG